MAPCLIIDNMLHERSWLALLCFHHGKLALPSLDTAAAGNKAHLEWARLLMCALLAVDIAVCLCGW